MIDVDHLLEETADATGLDDFGHPSYRDGLQRLLDAATASAELTPIGQAVLEGTCRAGLTNRLRVTHWHRTHPALAADEVDVSMIILGQSRSGTTALSHLLGADPANRSLRGWEANESVPPPSAETYWSDPRFERARNAPRLLATLNPEFQAIHDDPPDQPVECAITLGQHFASLGLSTMFHVPAYDEWLMSTEQTHAYEWHRQVLQVLQSECPGPWQLKSPIHCAAIDTVATTYPNAVFVMPHRDPVRCIASTCSLVTSLSGSFSAGDHRRSIAERWPELIATMLDRVMDFRRRHGDHRFVDVSYREFVDDPLATVSAIYDRIGRQLDAPTEAILRAHIAQSAQHRHGRHTYSLDEFGLSRAAIEERLAGYLERFDVDREQD